MAVSNPLLSNHRSLFCSNNNTPSRLPSVAASTIKNTTIRPASSCLASTLICRGRMLAKITVLMTIIHTLKQSHPIMILVIPSIFTEDKHTEMIVATQKLMSSL
jgi:hypothetical protein